MKTLFSFLMVLACLSLGAEAWQATGDASLLFNQNAYSDNWNGGETGSISWSMNFNYQLQKQIHAKMHNKNTLKLAFGQTHSQDKATHDWKKPEKSTDLIDFESLLRFTLGSYVDPFAAFRLESKFYDNSIPDDTKVLNPMTFTESFGIARVFVKAEKKELSSRLGGAFKQFKNRDESSNNGGIEFIADYKTPVLSSNIDFSSKLILYKALYYSESDKLEGLENEDYWKAVDVNWENIFSANIAKYLTANLYMQLLYDKELSLKGQFKETLALGLTYKL